MWFWLVRRYGSTAIGRYIIPPNVASSSTSFRVDLDISQTKSHWFVLDFFCVDLSMALASYCKCLAATTSWCSRWEDLSSSEGRSMMPTKGSMWLAIMFCEGMAHVGIDAVQAYAGSNREWWHGVCQQYTKASKRLYRFMPWFRPTLASLFHLFCSFSSASGCSSLRMVG